MDSVREGEGGKIWENGIETCKISCMKRVASPGLMHDTGCLGLPNPGIECRSRAFQADFLLSEPLGKWSGKWQSPNSNLDSLASNTVLFIYNKVRGYTLWVPPL